MSGDPREDRFSAALDLALAGSPSGIDPDDELFRLLGLAALLRENLTQAPAAEAFRTSLRDWLETGPPERWWETLVGPLGRGLHVAERRPAIGAALGAGAAAAIVIGLIVLRNRRAVVGVGR